MSTEVGEYLWEGKPVKVFVEQEGHLWSIVEEYEGVRGESCTLWFGAPWAEPSPPPRRIPGFLFSTGATTNAKKLIERRTVEVA